MKNSGSLIGQVIRKSDKTIIVKITRKEKHPVYGKYLNTSTKIQVHDEQNLAKVGDMVMVNQSRPISKNKSWILSSLL